MAGTARVTVSIEAKTSSIDKAIKKIEGDIRKLGGSAGKGIDIPVTADTSKAEGKIKAISAGSKVKIDVTADTSQARRLIDNVEASAGKVEIKVTADESQARRAINRLESTDGKAKILVTADTTRAKADINSLDSEGRVEIKVTADASAARRAIRDVEASAGDVKVKVTADTSAAVGALADLEKDRTAKLKIDAESLSGLDKDRVIDVDADVSKAVGAIDSLNGRTVTVDVNQRTGPNAIQRGGNAGVDVGGRTLSAGRAAVIGGVSGAAGAAGIETIEETLQRAGDLFLGTVQSASDLQQGFSRAFARARVDPESQDADAFRVEARRLGLTQDLIVNQAEVIEASTALSAQGVQLGQQVEGRALEATIALQNANPTASFELAGKTIAQATNQFGGDFIDNANLISNSILSSPFNLNDVRLLLSQGGGSAAAANQSLQDFLLSQTLIAEQFGSGSDAGTSAKTALARIIPETKKAKAAAAELGILYTDVGAAASSFTSQLGENVEATQAGGKRCCYRAG